MIFRYISLVIVFLFIFSNHLFSQKREEVSIKAISVGELNHESPKKDFSHLYGTFQIQYLKKDFVFLLTEDHLKKIEESRKEDEDIYVSFGEGMRVFVSSKNKFTK